MWFEGFKKDFRRILAYYQAEERLRKVFRTKDAADDPNVVKITSPPWWRRIFRYKAGDPIEVVSKTLPPSTPEELKAFMIDQFELSGSAADLSFDEVMIEVRKQMGADVERMESAASEITQPPPDPVIFDPEHPDFGLTASQAAALNPELPPAPVPFGQAPECVSCGSKFITGLFVKEGFKNHCATCGHTWIGEWPNPVITVPDKKDPK